MPTDRQVDQLSVKRVAAIVTRTAEVALGVLMGLMFLTFILQITIRYTARVSWLTEIAPLLDPSRYGWTLEFCLLLWVWIVFAGCALVVRREEHVTFDLLYGAVSPGLRRWFLIVGSVIIVVALTSTIQPTWEKFHILRLKKTATLSSLFGGWIRMRDVYSVYILFLVAVSIRFALGAWLALRSSGDGDID